MAARVEAVVSAVEVALASAEVLVVALEAAEAEPPVAQGRGVEAAARKAVFPGNGSQRRRCFVEDPLREVA